MSRGSDAERDHGEAVGPDHGRTCPLSGASDSAAEQDAERRDAGEDGETPWATGEPDRPVGTMPGGPALDPSDDVLAPGPWSLLRSQWRVIGRNLWNEIDRDNVAVVAAGVAFYGLLAIVPGIAALLTVYGLVAEPAEVEAQLREFRAILPDDVVSLLSEQLVRNAAQSTSQLSLELVSAFAVSLWSANRGMKAVMSAIHIAHGERERGFVMQNAIGMALTIGALLGLSVTLGLLVALPAVMRFVGLEGSILVTVSMLRWPVLFGFVAAALGLLYHVAPRRRPRWHLVSVGAVLATLLWLLGSWGFSVYVTNFGNYARIYGSLGAVVTLLLWLFVSAYIVILGVEINSLVQASRERAQRSGARA